ncbi:acyltransferase family protein [Chiayiivirga flava]|uniref:Peptidoglycan/LPS O-acetylase OafA/YrhL n=1 Tax=Chiayiivirga flava TaxID=659595 RepID=A0A7W8D4K9_9GAMM|nr:acyltransferase [Chiayiivirga flava]MBB5207814.1 peptidoglycan/LPS O-acetylase OafA/YrhL [Chiayiivirga flava]
MSATPPSHYPGLDPLRLAAALVVLGFHAIETADWSAGLAAHGAWGLLRAGWVGVDVFFVISGLVIGSSALRGVERGGAWRGDYWRRRLARIVPLYLVTCIVFLVAIDASAVTGPDGWTQALSHLFFVHNLFPHTLATINPPSWSLANEMQFYLLAMLAAPWLVRLRPITLAVGSIVLALVWRVGAWQVLRAQGIDDVGLFNWATLIAPGMLDSFGLGVALAIARRRGAPPPQGARRAWLVAGGVAMLLLPALWTEPMVRGRLWDTPAIALGLHTWAAIGATCLVWALHAATPAPRWRAAWLRAGELSYGVYLWHAIVLFALLAHTPWRGPALLAALLPPTLLLAWLGWVLVERPILRRAGAAQSIGSSSVKTV